MIHPTAVVDAEANVAPDVKIGPFAYIEEGATLGAGCVIAKADRENQV